MMIRILYSLLLWVILSSCMGRQVTGTPVAPVREVKNIEDDILHYVNEHRAKKNLPPLTSNPYIAEQAKKHSDDMASQHTPFGHKGLSDRMNTLSSRIGIISIAENVASGNMTAREVVDGWLHSPGHLRNIEGPYSLTGIGIATDSKGQIFFTQIFAGK